jgi:hypothetical protein
MSIELWFIAPYPPRGDLPYVNSCRIFKIYRGAAPGFTFRPYLPAMTLNYPPRNRETNADSREFTLGMEPLKWGEQLLAVRHIKSIAIVAHETNSFSPFPLGRKLDLRLRPLGSKFPGIGKKIIHDNAHQPRIGIYDNIVIDNEFHLSLKVTLLVTFKQILCQCLCDAA